MMIGSLWLAKSAVVGAVLKFGDAAVERFAKVQFMAGLLLERSSGLPQVMQ